MDDALCAYRKNDFMLLFSSAIGLAMTEVCSNTGTLQQNSDRGTHTIKIKFNLRQMHWREVLLLNKPKPLAIF